MIPFIEQAQYYATHHQNKLTRYTHMVGVPLILLSTMILFGFVHIVILGVVDFNVANIATLVLLIYYIRLQWRLALALTPLLIMLLWIANLFSVAGPTSFALWSFSIIALFGWTLEFIGHYFEGKPPAFTHSLWQLLIAPLLIVAELFFMAGRMKELQGEIYGEAPVNTPSNIA